MLKFSDPDISWCRSNFKLLTSLDATFIGFAFYMSIDFVQEARNFETMSNNFRNNKFVRVPRIFWVWNGCFTLPFLVYHLLNKLCLTFHASKYGVAM